MNTESKQVNIMLIGVGPHAQKVYVPWIAKHGVEYNAVLKVAVELNSQIQKTEQTFAKYELKPDMLFIDPLLLPEAS